MEVREMEISRTASGCQHMGLGVREECAVGGARIDSGSTGAAETEGVEEGHKSGTAAVSKPPSPWRGRNDIPNIATVLDSSPCASWEARLYRCLGSAVELWSDRLLGAIRCCEILVSGNPFGRRGFRSTRLVSLQRLGEIARRGASISTF
ncbi:hypothetical protein B296_00041633 [Ensete ventricosum]|uniref:Uncharacterized protein n=1 Tax=Ensete ventricosum TaxID=4639 RepID=A0A426ZL55_ENSVE|nr:hypothetical protein B296_00041633 [Ensete ventricosum]